MKLFYSTDEVSDHFGIAPSKVRYYVKEFGLKVKKSGNRSRFLATDIDKISDILQLVEKENYTITGAKQQLKLRKKVDANTKLVIQKLEGIKLILQKMHGGYE